MRTEGSDDAGLVTAERAGAEGARTRWLGFGACDAGDGREREKRRGTASRLGCSGDVASTAGLGVGDAAWACNDCLGRWDRWRHGAMKHGVREQQCRRGKTESRSPASSFNGDGAESRERAGLLGGCCLEEGLHG
ncbi:hypothetical protein M0R45_025903 [Rubus argutus]|uniref:Uncharacterized protein n=1 Tax=Rubus argutus TaxID=59490 RepID=A0AAW1WYH7_RUBAR